NAYRSEWEIRKAIEKQPESEDDRGAFDYFQIKVAFDTAFFHASRESECDRNTDDEKEKWKDEIGWRPAMPLSVFQWPGDAGPRAGIVHQHHACDRDTAKDIERDQPFGGHGAKITQFSC